MRYLLKIFTPFFILIAVVLSFTLLNERKEFDIRGLTQIDPIPKTWELIQEKRYAEADDYLSYFMQFDYVKENPKAVELYNALKEKRDSFDYKKEKIIEGIIKGKSDESIGKMSALASDFLVIGDIRDLILQGDNYINDKEVDKVIVALSSLGLIATASTIYSMGATAPAKNSISILKYAKRVDKIPNWLNKTIIREAKVSKETKSLKNLQNVFEPIYKLYQRVGLKDTLRLLKETKNVNELKGVLKLSKRFGKNSAQLVKLGGAKSIKELNAISNMQPKTILYASSYGDRGLTALKVMGESKFLKRVKFVSRASKTTYKGNFDDIFAKLLQIIPTGVLFGTLFFGLFYFIYKFYILTKKVGLLKIA